MQCASCKIEKKLPSEDELGHVFLPPKGHADRRIGAGSPRIEEELTWFVCDKCQWRGWPWLIELIGLISITAFIWLFIQFHASGLVGKVLYSVGLLIAGVFSLGFTWQELKWWFGGRLKRSRECRNEVLRKSYGRLKRREDFVAVYGQRPAYEEGPSSAPSGVWPVVRRGTREQILEAHEVWELLQM